MKPFPPLPIGKIGKAGIHSSSFSVMGLSPVLWLDASDLSTITESAGSVSQWDDKSGNANHAIQSAGASQPITGSRTIDGKNGLDFDGADDRLLLPNTTFPPNAFEPTFFAVYLPDNTSTGDYLIGNIGSSGNSTRKYFGNQSVDFGSARINKSSRTSGQALVQAAWAEGTGNTTQYLKIGTDAVLSGSVNNSYNASTWYPFVIGDAGYQTGFNAFEGVIGEIIAFDRQLTNAQINALGRGLSQKWGTTWADI